MKKENVLLRYIKEYLNNKNSDAYEELSIKLSENLKNITQSKVLREAYKLDIIEAINYHLKVLDDYLESFEDPLYLETALKNDFSMCPLCEKLERHERSGVFYDFEDGTHNIMCFKCKHTAQTTYENLEDEELEIVYEEYRKAYNKYQDAIEEKWKII